MPTILLNLTWGLLHPEILCLTIGLAKSLFSINWVNYQAILPGFLWVTMTFHAFFLSSLPRCLCAVLDCVQRFCDHMDCSPPGFSVHGISQAGILEWVAISSSKSPLVFTILTGLPASIQSDLSKMQILSRHFPLLALHWSFLTPG